MKELKTLPLVVFYFLLASSAFSQEEGTLASKFEKHTHTYNQTTLPYRLYIPEAYDSTKLYPIMLCLHGAGERGNDNEIQIRKHDLGIAWANPMLQKNNPCFILAPQCPKNRKWNYVSFGGGTFLMDTVTVGKEILAVLNLLDTLLNNYSIDPNRQYVTGLSMGGYGTWDIITRYPQRFAAAVPMSGAGDTSRVELLKNIPIWFFHNTHDKIVPVSGSRDMLFAMKRLDFDIVETLQLDYEELSNRIDEGTKYLYTESPEGNHGPWEPWYSDERLHKWVFLQSK